MQLPSKQYRAVNRIILIGNGFDLAHGFDLSFTSFIKHLIGKTIDLVKANLESKSNFLRIEVKLGYDQILKQNLLHDEPLEALGHLKRLPHQFVVKESSLLKKILKHMNDMKWVDLELVYFNELKENVETKAFGNIKDLNNQMNYLRDELKEYIKGKCIIDPNTANTAIARQMTEQCYGSNFRINNFANNILVNIHGTLDGDDKENGQMMIFGYGDEKNEKYLKFENSDAPIEAHELIKSYKYLEDISYRQVINFINQGDDFEVVIMGHSCGQSDRTLLRTIFNHDRCIAIRPFYFERPDGADDYFEKSVAIAMCFDDKEKFRDIMSPKPECEPLIQARQIEN